MPAELVKFPGPDLSDIPAQLRALADAIESGEHGEILTAYCILAQPADYPLLFGFGDVTTGETHPIVQMEMAKSWLINNLVERC